MTLIPTDPQLAELLTDLSCYAPCRPLAHAIAVSAYTHCPDGYPIPRFAWGTVAIAAQESGLGHLLTPPGPIGAGDWTARTGAWLRRELVRVVAPEEGLPSGWVSSRPGPWAIPSDGQGWGRWLFQNDWCDPVHGAFVRENPGASESLQVDHFAGAWAELLERYSCVEANAAEGYNADPAKVSAELLAGLDPDDITTQHYGSRFSDFMKLWAPGGAQ